MTRAVTVSTWRGPVLVVRAIWLLLGVDDEHEAERKAQWMEHVLISKKRNTGDHA